MSFDLFLQRFEGGGDAELNRAAMLPVLRRHTQDGPDRFGFYKLSFADASSLEFSAAELDTDAEFMSCGFHLHEFSPAILSFVFEMAKAGEAVIFNTQGEDSDASPTLIVLSEHQVAGLPEEVDMKPVLCETAEHLSGLLGSGIRNWSAYRDQVAGEAD